jgi:hypothetical protein
MRIERIVLGFGLALATSGCGSILQDPGDGGSDGAAGHDGGGGACRGLTEAACRARTDCTAAVCSGICGGPTFAGCYDPATETAPPCPGIGAPAGTACPPPVTCSLLTDEASCQARSDCQANYCPNCNGGTLFSGCSNAGSATSICPAIACPVPCSEATTLETCDARPDCHPVFVDNRACGCAALGCCAKFSRCADGATALCKAPPIACDALTPYCEGPYVVGYTNACYEGCVRSTDCAVN